MPSLAERKKLLAWRPNPADPNTRLDRSGNTRHQHEPHEGLIALIKRLGLPARLKVVTENGRSRILCIPEDGWVHLAPADAVMQSDAENYEYRMTLTTRYHLQKFTQGDPARQKIIDEVVTRIHDSLSHEPATLLEVEDIWSETSVAHIKGGLPR